MKEGNSCNSDNKRKSIMDAGEIGALWAVEAANRVKRRLLCAAWVVLAASSAGRVEAQSLQGGDWFDNRIASLSQNYLRLGYIVSTVEEGRSSSGDTVKFVMPVQRGFDYILIVIGDRSDQMIWIESEIGSTIIKDTRANQNGFAGVAWTSNYTGTVDVVIQFEGFSGPASWTALAGRRGRGAPADPGAPPGK